MSILHTLFERPLSDDLIKSLGNMIISGAENDGSRLLYFNMLSKMLEKRESIVIVNGSVSDEQHKALKTMISSRMMGRKMFDFRYCAEPQCFDMLSAFENVEKKAEFMEMLISAEAILSETTMAKAQRFFLYVMMAYEADHKTYKLRDIMQMDLDYAIDFIKESHLDDDTKKIICRFLEDSSMSSVYLEIETSVSRLKSYKLLDILSGDESMMDLLSEGNVIMINAFLSDSNEKKTNMLLNSIVFAIIQCIERTYARSKVNFVIKNADENLGMNLYNMMSYNDSYDFAVYLFADDISRCVSAYGNGILDKTKSVVVFQQRADENAQLWSAYFGRRVFLEKTLSYTKKKGWNPFVTMRDNGGVIPAPRKYNSETISFSKTDRPIYRPDVFTELKPMEVMCYLREPLMRKKSRIGE